MRRCGEVPRSLVTARLCGDGAPRAGPGPRCWGAPRNRSRGPAPPEPGFIRLPHFLPSRTGSRAAFLGFGGAGVPVPAGSPPRGVPPAPQDIGGRRASSGTAAAHSPASVEPGAASPTRVAQVPPSPSESPWRAAPSDTLRRRAWPGERNLDQRRSESQARLPEAHLLEAQNRRKNKMRGQG